MGRADEDAIRSGTPAEVLMERAGQAVARAAIDLAGGRYGRRAVAVCGAGNNAGDGYVAARALASEGLSVCCYAATDPESLQGAARHHFELYRRLGGIVTRERAAIDGADVVVDALFGTGYRADKGPLPGGLADAVDAINEARAAVVAIDVPSGVDGSTGAIAGPAVRADVTVVMGAEKVGTALPPGARHAGRVKVVDIGIPTGGYGGVRVLAPPGSVPRREPTVHKRSAGSVVVLAGSDAMPGAALLAVRGAQRIGAGYVTLGTTAAVKETVHRSCPEAIVVDAGGETIGRDALYALADAIRRADAVAIGPGIGTGDAQRALVERLLATVDVPVVLDADALNALAADPAPLSERGRRRTADVVLTPHPAELARLLGTDTEEIQEDRIGAAREAAGRFAATIVLKGWRSVVAPPPSEGSCVEVCPTGGPELATAGTGDVLTGAIAGLGGHYAAARAGVYVHGLAGTVAGERSGRSGVVAWDVAEALPAAWERISAGEVADWLS